MHQDVRDHRHRCQRARRRDPRPHAGHPRAGRPRETAGRGAGPERPDAAVPAGPMRAWRVSTRANRPENADPRSWSRSSGDGRDVLSERAGSCCCVRLGESDRLAQRGPFAGAAQLHSHRSRCQKAEIVAQRHRRNEFSPIRDLDPQNFAQSPREIPLVELRHNCTSI